MLPATAVQRLDPPPYVLEERPDTPSFFLCLGADNRRGLSPLPPRKNSSISQAVLQRVKRAVHELQRGSSINTSALSRTHCLVTHSSLYSPCICV